MVKNLCLPVSTYVSIKASIDEHKEAHLHGGSIDQFKVGDDIHLYEMKDGYKFGDPVSRKNGAFTGNDFFVHLTGICEMKTPEGKKAFDMKLIPRS